MTSLMKVPDQTRWQTAFDRLIDQVVVQFGAQRMAVDYRDDSQAVEIGVRIDRLFDEISILLNEVW